MGTDWRATPPEMLRVGNEGAKVELLVWGEAGRPGLLLLHGAGAHARWWDAVAPLLARDYRVAAMSVPGAGGSDWRDRYSSAAIFADAVACANAAGLGIAGKPVFVGHSMGGAHLMHGAVHEPDAIRALVLVDTSFRTPGGRSDKAPARRIFATEAEVLERFRLMPPGPAREPGLLAHVATHAIERVEGGWSWRADPEYRAKFASGIEQGPYPARLCPLIPTAHLIADLSHVAAADDLPLGPDVTTIMLPDCGHHVMLDRPLVLVAALRALLAVWP